MKRIDGSRAEAIRIAQNQRLHAVEQAGARRQKKILSVVNRRIAKIGKEVTAEYRVGRVVDPVDARERLILITWIRDAVQQFPARIRRGRHILQEGQSLRIEAARRDDIARKGAVRAGIDQSSRLAARGRFESAEVSAQRIGGRHENRYRAGCGAGPSALVPAEYK